MKNHCDHFEHSNPETLVDLYLFVLRRIQSRLDGEYKYEINTSRMRASIEYQIDGLLQFWVEKYRAKGPVPLGELCSKLKFKIEGDGDTIYITPDNAYTINLHNETYKELKV